LGGGKVPVVKTITKYGLINSKGIKEIDCVYDDIEVCSKELVCLQQEDKWYIYNIRNQKKIETKLHGLKVIQNGLSLAQFKTNKKSGVIDRNANIIVEPIYEEIWGCGRTQIYLLVIQNGKLGILDVKGNIILNPIYENAWYYKGNVIIFRQNNLWGFANKLGRVILKPTYQDMHYLEDGLFRVKKNNLYGVIDENNYVILDFKFDDIKYCYNNTFAINQHSMWRIISRDRLLLTNSLFNDIKEPETDFEKENGIVKLKINDKWYLLNLKLMSGFKAEFDDIGRFYEGAATTCSRGLYGYVTSIGEIIVPPSFVNARPFFSGMASVKIKNKYGFIDMKGNTVINPRYDFAEGFCDCDLSSIIIGNKYGFINKKGDIVVEPRYYSYRHFVNSLAVIVEEKESVI
jgi:hypothetical protein